MADEKNRKKSAEFSAFQELTDRLLTVPHSAVRKAVENHRKEAAKNPYKRGPKPRTAK